MTFLACLKHPFQLNLELLLSGRLWKKIGLLFIPNSGHTDEAREGIHRNCRNGLPVERAASRGTWVCRRRVRRQGFDARNVEASVLTPSENYVNLCRLLRRLS